MEEEDHDTDSHANVYEFVVSHAESLDFQRQESGLLRRHCAGITEKKAIGRRVSSVNGSVTALAGLVLCQEEAQQEHQHRDHGEQPVHVDVRQSLSL